MYQFTRARNDKIYAANQKFWSLQVQGRQEISPHGFSRVGLVVQQAAAVSSGN
jgi:hypothetical protein